MASDERYQCCPFARSGGLHGEDCTYAGKSHCLFRLAAEGLHVVTDADKAVLDAMAAMPENDLVESVEQRDYYTPCWWEEPAKAELARREAKP